MTGRSTITHPRITGPSNLRPGDVVVRLGQERTVARVVRQVDDTVVDYDDGGPPDTFGVGATVFRRRPA